MGRLNRSVAFVLQQTGKNLRGTANKAKNNTIQSKTHVVQVKQWWSPEAHQAQQFGLANLKRPAQNHHRMNGDNFPELTAIFQGGIIISSGAVSTIF